MKSDIVVLAIVIMVILTVFAVVISFIGRRLGWHKHVFSGPYLAVRMSRNSEFFAIYQQCDICGKRYRSRVIEAPFPKYMNEFDMDILEENT